MKRFFILSLIAVCIYASVSYAQENQPVNPSPVSGEQPGGEANSGSSSPAASEHQNKAGGSPAPDAASIAQADQQPDNNPSGENGKAPADVSGSDNSSAGDQPQETKKEHPADKSYYEPSRNHNPMMSPRDYEKIRLAEQARLEAEREARLAAEAAERAARQPEEYKPKVKKVDPLKILDRKLRLQAIINDEVVINGENYSRGKVIKKTDGAKVKTIGENYIIVEYKGRTLRKVLKD